MDNLVKKQKNGIILALIAKLMGLAIVLNIASCSCGKEKDLAIKLTADKEVLELASKEGTTELKVKHEEGPELDLKTVKLVVVKTVYEAADLTGDANGKQDNLQLKTEKLSDIDGKNLQELTGKDKLKKGDEATIKISVTMPKEDTRSGSVKFTLEKEDGSELKSVTVKYTNKAAESQGNND